MASLTTEKHPEDGPIPTAQLHSFVAQAVRKGDKTKSQLQRDMRKKDIRAQLFWYSIEYTNLMILPTLEKVLREAFERGRCDDNAPRIQEHQRRESEAKRAKEEAWQKCTTPGERACEDLDRFMEHYFYTNGSVDCTKTTKALALHGYTNRSDLHHRVERIDGLVTHSGGEDRERTVCIGWDRDAVWRLAATIDNESRESKVKEQEATWAEDMEEHHAFVESLKKKKKSKNSAGLGTNREKLDRYKGRYVVRCDELSGNWDNCDTLTVDIATGPKPGILQAAVDFGIIEGTMLLAFNETDLDAYVQTTSLDSDSYSDSGHDDEEGYTEDEDLVVASTSKKRKASTKSVAPKTGRGRPSKKAKASSSTTNRLFIRFRGRETGEGCVFYVPKKGYLNFTDSSCVAFKGVCAMPAVGSKVPFEGFKIDGKAAVQAEPWSSFSESIYEEERIGRWG